MKKILAVSSIVGTIALAALVILQPGKAQAEDNHGDAVHPMVININGNGKALIRGVIVSSTATTTGTSTASTTPVTNGTLMIKSWGITFTVNVANAEIAGPTKDVSIFKVGDFVGINGVVNENNPLMVTATVVHDWSSTVIADKKIEKDDRNDEHQLWISATSTATTTMNFLKRGEHGRDN